VALLSRPETYGLPPGTRIERVDTHIAHVFLAGPRAYKLKRAVRLPFLDFSTLDRRRAACEAELRINRRTAPDYYHRLVPVTRAAGGVLALDGDGDTVDWVVEMKRFPDGSLLDEIARRDGVDAGLANALAAAVAAFHGRAEVRQDFAGADEIRRTHDMNMQRIEAFSPLVFDGGQVATLRDATAAGWRQAAEILDRRRETGMVRYCHGDLHLRNIFLDGGRPVLFDAIEFDDRLAIIDVMYDIAFLVMDLWHRDLREAANRVLNRYLLFTGDFEGLALMPLFLSLRAAIRAHVTANMAQDAGDPVPLHDEARQYLALAIDFLAPCPPVLVGVGGFSGSGKSTVAATLAPRIGPPPGAICLRSDEIRKHLWGVAPEESLPKQAYARDVSRRVYADLRDRAGRVLRAGYAAIGDAVHDRRDARDALAGVARAAGVPFAGFWLQADEELLIRRVTGRHGDASDADADVVRAQLAGGGGNGDWQAIDASATAESCAGEMFAAVAERTGAGGKNC
jgi:aminoglycoside phosphotransferase family enzyme/predicted kinase